MEYKDKTQNVIYSMTAGSTVIFLYYLLEQQQKTEEISQSTNIWIFTLSIMFFCVLYFFLALMTYFIRRYFPYDRMLRVSRNQIRRNGYVFIFLSIWIVFLFLFYNFVFILIRNETTILGHSTLSSLWQVEAVFSAIFLTFVAFAFFIGLTQHSSLKSDKKYSVLLAQGSIICIYLHASFFSNYLFNPAVAHHGNAYYTSIYNILHNAPYSDINNSIYGCYALILAPILKMMGPLSMTKFGWLMSSVCVVYILCITYSVNSLLKRNSLKILGVLASVATVIGFRTDPYYQTQPHRIIFSGMMLAYAVFTLKKGKNHLAFQAGGFVLAAIAIIWNKETGFVCAVSWGILQIYWRIRQNCKKSVWFWIGIFLSILGIVFAFFLAVTIVGIYNLSVSGSWIEINVFMFPLFNKDYMIDMLQTPLYNSLNIDIVIFLTFMYPVANAIYKLFRGLERTKENPIIQDTCISSNAAQTFDSKEQKNSVQMKKHSVDDRDILYVAEPIVRDCLLLFCALLGIGLLPYYVNRPAYFNLDITHGFFFILICVYTEKNISNWVKQRKTYRISRAIHGILSYSGIFLLFAFSTMSVLHFYTSDRSRMNYRTTDQIESLAREIQDFVPENTIAFGNGIAEIYTILGWDSQLYMLDASDLDVSLTAKEYLAQFLDQLDEPILIGENQANPILLNPIFAPFLRSFRLENQTTYNEIDYLYFVPDERNHSSAIEFSIENSKDFILKVQNQINYSIFRQSGTIIVGEHGDLVEKPYVEEYFRIREPTSDMALEELTNTLQELKIELEKIGIPLIVFITPNKAEFIQDALTNRFSQKTQSNFPSRDIDRFVPLLIRKEIPYIHCSEILKTKVSGIALFPKTGAHWTLPAAFFCTQELLEKIGQNIPVQQIEEFTILSSSTPLYSVDLDLFHALDVFSAKKDEIYYDVKYTPSPEIPEFSPPRVLFQGGSYCHQIRELLLRENIVSFDQLFYSEWYLDSPSGGSPLDAEFNGIDLSAILSQTDVVVLEVNEEYISNMGSGFPSHLLTVLRNNIS